MKKFYALTVCILACLTGMSQTPWDPSQGPLDFMTLTAPYVKCSTGMSPNDYNSQQGIQGSGTQASHRIITTQGPDECRCYTITGSAPYIHENVLPPSWSGNPIEYLPSVIRLGCTSCNNGFSNCTCSRNSEILYSFYPQVDSSTLLVYFTFAEDDIPYHPAADNPRFYIEVLDQNNQLLNLGYYHDQYGAPMINKPYSRFCAVPSGQDANLDYSLILPENEALGIITYYWAFPETTPTNYDMRACPASQTGSAAVNGDYVKWFEYRPLAFDLSQQAANGELVKLRIRVRSCEYNTHWGTAMFAAKMISGTLQVDACGNEPIHLSVPWGFDERTYVWRYGYNAMDASTRPALDPLSPPVGIFQSGHDIYIDRDALLAAGQPLWPYFRCEMYTYTGVPFVYEAEIKSYFLEPDFTFEQQGDCDLCVQLIDNSDIYTTLPPSSSTASWDTIYQPTQLIQWFVKNLQTNEFDPIPNHYGDTSFIYVFEEPYVDFSTGEAVVKIVIQDAEGKCIKDTAKTIQLLITDVPARERETVTVMPNPTSGSVRVSADQDIQSIRILNADGKLLSTVTVQDKAATLDLSHYDGSLFLLDVRFKDGGNVVKKVVKG